MRFIAICTGKLMKPSEALELHRADIRRIVEMHHGLKVRVFGSVLYGEDTEDSDLDLLVEPSVETSLLDIAKMQVSLEKLLGVRIDVVTPRGLPESFRSKVLESAVQL
jgi:predicted nucleotidyltransferase